MFTIPEWDGKVKSWARIFAQITALAKFYDCGDVFIAINSDADEKHLMKLYNANKCILAIMILGMDSIHGLVVIQQTVSLDFLQGKAD
jgi:hypothetical protein